ncbi:cellulase family glycosylhydrolase [Devosia neptuniae]|uniref:Cellulase family glycosylhydrolase n=1 Tax=Devosia neptuniae TaxID=191302 RepID=A0ABY6CL97_9HYPH|nr:cellulase family glycosylhydrolase [Devosia neptuniae]UXN70798.1 cellulase family glycosylhydrolase [Devosia neptuniae]
MRRRAVLAGLAGLAAPAPAQQPTRIEISGHRLLWNDAPLRLCGIAMGDPVYIRAGRSLDDYRVVAQDWGANCVRISVHPGHWRYDPVLMAQYLDTDIAAARAQGLFVIVDWHVIGFPDHYEPVPPPEWGLPPDAYLSSIADAIAFWTSMAQRHGDDPHGPREILGPGHALVPVGNPALLAEAILQALDQPVDHAALRRRAADFTTERTVEAFAAMLGGMGLAPAVIPMHETTP